MRAHARTWHAEDRLQHLMRGRVGQSQLWWEGFIPRWAVVVSDSMVCQKSIPTVTVAAYFDGCGHRHCDSARWLHIWGLFLSLADWVRFDSFEYACILSPETAFYPPHVTSRPSLLLPPWFYNPQALRGLLVSTDKMVQNTKHNTWWQKKEC